MASPTPADRNLLAGIFALQHEFITRDQLVEAMNRWVLQKATPLERLLPLTGDDRALLTGMLRRHLAKHHDDVAQSLRSLPLTCDVRQQLEEVADPGLVNVLTLVGGSPSKPNGSVETVAPSLAEAGTRLRFHPVQVHAKGGLGVVFLARDTDLERQVALKEIRLDRDPDHPAVRARFRREGEITGKLEHPGVVPIYAMDTYADGRPYYAMRFVQGEPMSEAIDRFHTADLPGRDPAERSLAMRELLARFVAVCNTIGHAHSKGVIHRDLKPANVMLGDYGETIVVDWGLARLLGRPESEDLKPPAWLSVSENPGSQVTRQGEVFGTPGFMPPEQAEGRVELVGVASDVFSLGAVLYSVLTGRAPHDGEDALARARRGEVAPARQVKRSVPAALEAVCRKAMAMDPQDRYASAKELAAEVERWLGDELVSAYREPLREKARRWRKRHRGLVGAGLAVLMTGVAALSVGLFAVGTEQRKTADALADAQANLARAHEAEKEATENLKLARRAIDECFNVAKEHPLFLAPGMEKARKLLLEKTLPFYKHFRAQRPDDDQLHLEEARQWHNVGFIEAVLGRPREAQAANEQARDLYAPLVEAHPDVPAYLQGLATAHNNLAAMLMARGQGEAALREQRLARDLAERLVKARPGVPEHEKDLARLLNSLGIHLQRLGQPEAALREHERARDIGARLVQDHPGVPDYANALASTHNNMGLLLGRMGKAEESAREYHFSRGLNARLVQAHPDVPKYQKDLAAGHNNMGMLLMGRGKANEALEELRQARGLFERLARTHPAVPEYRFDLAGSHNNLGVLLRDLGRPAESMQEHRQARGLFARLVKAHPDIPEYAEQLGYACTNSVAVLARCDGLGEVLPDFDLALSHLGPANTRAGAFLPVGLLNRSVVLARLGRLGDADADWRRALDLTPPGRHGALKQQRADRRARAGDYQRAAAEADELGRASPIAGPTLYDLACIYALNADCAAGDRARPLPEREKRAEEYACQAVALLQRAAASGFFTDKANVAHMSQDADLAALRGRDDFRQFVAGFSAP